MSRTSKASMAVGSLILAMSPVVNADAAGTKAAPASKVNGISGQCGGLFGGDRGDMPVMQDTVTMANGRSRAVQPSGDGARRNDCHAPGKPVTAAPPPGKPR